VKPLIAAVAWSLMTKRKTKKPAQRAKASPRKGAPPKRPGPPAGSEKYVQPMDWTARVVLIGVSLFGVLHLVASFVPSVRLWGVDYWSEFPVVIRLAMVAVLGLSLAPGIARTINSGFSSVFQSHGARLAGFGVLAVVFILFRSQGLSYGDGYTFPAYLGAGQLPEFDPHTMTQALDIVAHWALYRFVLMPFGGTVEISYAIWGAIAGVLSLWALVWIASGLTRDPGGRRLIVAAGVTSGAVVLWFGHVESYTLVNAAILWMIAFALDAQERGSRIWAAWGCWTLAVAFHQLALAVLPAVVWAHWRSRRRDTSVPSRTTVASIAGAGFLAWAVATHVHHQISAFPVFVPIFPTEDSVYSAFSPDHLADMLNLILFLAPAAVAGLVVWLTRGGGRGPQMGRIGIVAVSAIAAWYFAFWVDPFIGAFRDWDLLAAFGIPMSIWAAATVVSRARQGRVVPWLWVPVAMLGLVHAGGFVAIVQDEFAAAMRVERMVKKDVHYGAGFFDGSRLPPWAAILSRALDRPDLAKHHLSRRVAIAPDDALAWANLGNAYQQLDMIDSAAVSYEAAVAEDSTNQKFWNNLGVLQTSLGNYQRASEAYEAIIAMSDTAYAARATAGMMYIQLGRRGDARRVLDDAIALRPTHFFAYFARGVLNEVTGDTTAALQDYESSYDRGGRFPELFTRMVQLYQWSGQTTRSVEAARRWQEYDPSSHSAVFQEGTAHYLAGDYDLAKAAFERAALLDQQNALTLYYLASCSRLTGNPEEAKLYAQRAAALDRQLALPYMELIYLADDAGDRDAAVAATREYLRRAPGDSGMPYLQQFMDR
jgi:tetratricopeptide (TPR) repeat protein